MEMYDITIIGGGPAGLYAAFYSGLRELKVKIIEAKPYFGGKMQLYPEKIVWDLGGQPPTLACQLSDQIIRQGLTFNPSIVLNEKIIGIEKEDDYFIARSEHNTHRSKAIIIAIGGGVFSPQRLSIFDRSSENVHYTLKAPTTYRNKKVALTGKGVSVFDWANALGDVASAVSVIVSEQNIKIPCELFEQLKKKNVNIYESSTITTVHSEGGTITSLEISQPLKEDRITLAIDEMLINLGYDRDFTLLSNCQLPIETGEHGLVHGKPNGTTSVPGLFAIGDIIKHDAKLNLLTGAFQDAANTVNEVAQYLNPKARKTAMVSTHNAVFKERNKQL